MNFGYSVCVAYLIGMIAALVWDKMLLEWFF